MSLLGASIIKNLANQSWLKGPSDIIEAVRDPDRYGDKYVQGLISGITVPSGINWMARTQDPYLREVHSILEGMKARIPGLSDTLLPRRDVFGEPMRREQPIVDDPVVNRMIAVGYFPSKLGRTITGVELTDQQYDDYARTAGRLARMRLELIVSRPDFANAPAAQMRDIMKDAVDASRDSARKLIQMQYFSIVRAATEDKLRDIRGEPKPKGSIKQPVAP